jgi:hypothetical protein
MADNAYKYDSRRVKIFDNDTDTFISLEKEIQTIINIDNYWDSSRQYHMNEKRCCATLLKDVPLNDLYTSMIDAGKAIRCDRPSRRGTNYCEIHIAYCQGKSENITQTINENNGTSLNEISNYWYDYFIHGIYEKLIPYHLRIELHKIYRLDWNDYNCFLVAIRNHAIYLYNDYRKHTTKADNKNVYYYLMKILIAIYLITRLRILRKNTCYLYCTDDIEKEEDGHVKIIELLEVTNRLINCRELNDSELVDIAKILVELDHIDNFIDLVDIEPDQFISKNSNKDNYRHLTMIYNIYYKMMHYYDNWDPGEIAICNNSLAQLHGLNIVTFGNRLNDDSASSHPLSSSSSHPLSSSSSHPLSSSSSHPLSSSSSHPLSSSSSHPLSSSLRKPLFKPSDNIRLYKPVAKSQSSLRTRTQSPPRTRTQSPPRTRTQSSPRTRTQSLPRTRTQSSPRTQTQSSPRTRTQSPPRTRTQSPPRTRTQSPPRTRTQSPPRTRYDYMQ